MFHAFIRPGQGFGCFDRYIQSAVLSETGRYQHGDREYAGTIQGIISLTSPQEREAWGSTEHPVTHKIIQQGNQNAAKCGDILVQTHNTDRRFYYIEAVPKNPGGFPCFTVYYCSERSGLDG